MIKIVSGGQIGADQAALYAAEKAGKNTGGYAPPGFMTVNGSMRPLLKDRFGLKEIEREKGKGLAYYYVERSKRNVDESDGTIAFRMKPSRGTDCTINYCLTGIWGMGKKNDKVSRKYATLIIGDILYDDDRHDELVQHIVSFILDNQISTLNVAGHRDYDSEWSKRIETILSEALLFV